MLVGEIVLRKDYIKYKIAETEKKLSALSDNEDIEPRQKGALYSSFLEVLFELYSKLQSHRALLDSENAKTEIPIGNSTLSVLDAVHIRETLKTKIDLITGIIDNISANISYSELLTKREDLMENYISVCGSIKTSDWSKEVELD